MWEVLWHLGGPTSKQFGGVGGMNFWNLYSSWKPGLPFGTPGFMMERIGVWNRKLCLLVDYAQPKLCRAIFFSFLVATNFGLRKVLAEKVLGWENRLIKIRSGWKWRQWASIGKEKLLHHIHGTIYLGWNQNNCTTYLGSNQNAGRFFAEAVFTCSSKMCDSKSMGTKISSAGAEHGISQNQLKWHIYVCGAIWGQVALNQSLWWLVQTQCATICHNVPHMHMGVKSNPGTMAILWLLSQLHMMVKAACQEDARGSVAWLNCTHRIWWVDEMQCERPTVWCDTQGAQHSGTQA